MKRQRIANQWIEESKVNKGQMLLIIQTEFGDTYVVAGDHYDPSSLVPYEICFHTKKQDVK